MRDTFSASPGMSFTADELLNLSIMTKSAILILEGSDDVPIYERLAESINLDCEIYASQNILSGREGCGGVIENIRSIREVSGSIGVEKYVLGVIDRDARYYRNEIPSDPAIFVLNYYSIESHFVDACSIKYLIPRVTRATNRLIREDDCVNVYERIKSKLMFLYLLSLEALKNACIVGYNSGYGYKAPIKSILNMQLHLTDAEKESNLRDFGFEHGLHEDWDSLLKICKGKWVHELYSDYLHEEIKNLPTKCSAGEVSKCQFCLNGDSNKCLYKNTAFISSDILRQQSFLNTEVYQLQYIKDRMLAMVRH